MKKIILMTTVAGCALFGTERATYADAVSPTLTIGGDLLGTMSYVSQSRPYGKGRGTHFAVNKAKINFKAEGRVDNVLYSFNVVLNGDAAPTQFQDNQGNVEFSDLKTGRTIEQSYMEFITTYGAFVFGNAKGAEENMIIDARRIWGADGGADGYWSKVVNLSQDVYDDVSVVGKTDYATKLSYYTPRMMGVQFGVSYTPNTQHHGNMPKKDNLGYNFSLTQATSYGKFDNNNWAAGLNFMHDFDGVKVELSAVGIAATQTRDGADGTKLRRTKSYALGGVLSWNGFSIGGGYGDGGKSRTTVGSINTDAGKLYNVGIAYTAGATTVSAGYYNSAKKNNDAAGKKLKADIYSVAVDYKIAQGLAVYGQGLYARTRTNDTALKAANNGVLPATNTINAPYRDNNAKVFSFGTKIKF